MVTVNVTPAICSTRVVTLVTNSCMPVDFLEKPFGMPSFGYSAEIVMVLPVISSRYPTTLLRNSSSGLTF